MPRPRFLPPLVLTLALAAALPAAAQYRIDAWTSEQGLPQSTVNGLCQTRDGFLWMVTNSGLARFDGVRFKVFDTTTNPELPSSRLNLIREDSDRRLWVRTEDGVLLQFLDGRFIRQTTADGLLKDKVGWVDFEPARSRAGLLSVFFDDGQQFVLRGRRFEKFTPPPDNRPRNGNGVMIIGGSWNDAVFFEDAAGTHRWDKGRISPLTPPFDERPIYEDRAGQFWSRTRDGQLILASKGRIARYGEQDGVARSTHVAAFEDPDGTLWWYQTEGLTVYRNGRFLSYTTANGLPDNRVNALYQDLEGTHWIQTEGGLARATELAITTYTTADGLDADNTYPVVANSRGDIWIGGSPGLTRYRDGRFEKLAGAHGGSANVLSLLEDRDGAIWLAIESSGVRRVKNGQVTVFNGPDAPGVTSVIYQGRGDDIWFGTGAGFWRYRNGEFLRFWEEQGFHGGAVTSFHDDASGALWIGGDAGLTRYERGTFTNYGQTEGFAGRRVRTFHQSRDGTIWIGTDDTGLFRLRDGQFTRYTTREGLPSNGAFTILEDDEARLWIGSNVGIYRVAIAELDDLSAGRRGDVTAVKYGRSDGMRNQECNGRGQPAGVRAADGRLWFATQQGVAVVDPSMVRVHEAPPRVAILELLVGGRAVPTGGPIEIRDGSSTIEAQYTALTFFRAEQTKFKYRMEGVDAGWVDAGTDRTARYPELPYGSFRFRVIAANRDGVWNQDGASVAIVVVRPFYRTWWFNGLVVIAIGLTGFGVHRWRLGLLERQRRLQESFSRQLIDSQEIDRRRIASELHDGLSQSLIVIKNWAVLSEQSLPDGHAAKPRLVEITKTAADALGEVREVVQDLVPYHLERLGLADSLQEMAARVGDASGIDITCALEDIASRLTLDAQMSLYRVVQEGLNNIAKHSGASHASLDLSVHDHSLRVVLRDDGRGFQPGKPRVATGPGGFGLVGMSERIRMMGGTMTVGSSAGRGAVIVIELPLQSAPPRMA